MLQYATVVTKDIGFYANRTLSDVGLKEPPVEIGPILDYFDIQLLRTDDDEMTELENRTGEKMHVPAFLLSQNGKTLIVIRGSDSQERQRLSVFHEIGHYDLPWHDDMNFACDCVVNGQMNLKALEKEAFEYAGLMMFPQNWFTNDLMNMPTGLDSIEILATRYGASFEATAIRYVRALPGLCAVVYLQLNPNADASGSPFCVKYCVTSKRFYGFWKPGQGVHHHDLIASSLQYGQRVQGEIPARVFGSSKSHSYLMDLKPHGIGQVCAFLMMEDSQTDIFGGMS